MFPGNPNAFTASPLDKCGVQRKDEVWVNTQRVHPKAKFLLFYRGELLIDRQPTKSHIQWLTMDALSTLPMDRDTVLLGMWGDEPIWAVDASSADYAPFSDVSSYAPLRQVAPFLRPEELAIAGQGSWLLAWNKRTNFCALDGGKLIQQEGGFKRINPKTGSEHFPRTDPVAIVLPYKGDKICLGRGPQFPAGFMSAFAGYLEPGETVEECGARELYEEVGLKAVKMEYLFSQPWPFPSSLMMGFLAEVENEDLTLDPTEIEEAKWFTRAEAQAAYDGDGDIMVPPKMAIAHQLLKVWLER